MNVLFTAGSLPDSDPGNLINFQVSTPTPVTVGPTADWPLRMALDSLPCNQKKKRTKNKKTLLF